MDTRIINVECVVLTTAAVGAVLFLLLALLRRSRPDLALGQPLAVGFGLRVLVIAGLSATGLGQTLWGGDETTFMAQAHQVAAQPWGSGVWLPWDHSSFLHVLVLAVQLKLLGSPEGAMRITQVGIALAGVVLIATAIYDLASPRVARLAMWLLCLEPASLLFNEVLHKEPNMELATGLVVFGGVKVWRKLDYAGVAIMLAGSLIALGTRRYIGWFLFACTVMLILHAALRRLSTGRDMRALPLIYGVAIVMFLATPALLAATSQRSLQANLQPAQNENSSSTAGNGHANGNNLALESVNFSTRSAIVTNLPLRIRDVLLRPYPWQAGDFSQMVGVVGSVVALAVFFLLIRFGLRSRGQVFERAGPLLYPFLFLTVGYALSVGNAGTGFRYRTHLVTLAIAAMLILREAVLDSQEQESDDPNANAGQLAPGLRERIGQGVAVV